MPQGQSFFREYFSGPHSRLARVNAPGLTHYLYSPGRVFFVGVNYQHLFHMNKFYIHMELIYIHRNYFFNYNKGCYFAGPYEITALIIIKKIIPMNVN